MKDEEEEEALIVVQWRKRIRLWCNEGGEFSGGGGGGLGWERWEMSFWAMFGFGCRSKLLGVGCV